MTFKHYHLIGICGTAMASLAGMVEIDKIFEELKFSDDLHIILAR